jgi:hypothetical protein
MSFLFGVLFGILISAPHVPHEYAPHTFADHVAAAVFIIFIAGFVALIIFVNLIDKFPSLRPRWWRWS